MDSVNHRVLDGRPEATDFIQKVLVASSVEQAEKKKDTVTLRNSTVLPRQPGLLGILVALFAPCVELKLVLQTLETLDLLLGQNFRILFLQANTGAFNSETFMLNTFHRNDKTLSSTGYTGAIAGVGFAPSIDGRKALSLYPDHDMRVQFDTVLTPVDVEVVCWMG